MNKRYKHLYKTCNNCVYRYCQKCGDWFALESEHYYIHPRKNRTECTVTMKYYSNKENYKLRKKIWYSKNKDIIKEKKHIHYLKNKEAYKVRNNRWALNNKERLRISRALYMSKDITRRLTHNMRNRVRRVILRYSKSKATLEMLGCSIEEFKYYIHSKFTEGMTWDNYGQWHIDHILPCASFDLSDPSQQIICFHYSNLQPLWAKDNLSKGARVL